MESPGACTANSIKSVCIEVFISSPQPHDLIGWEVRGPIASPSSHARKASIHHCSRPGLPMPRAWWVDESVVGPSRALHGAGQTPRLAPLEAGSTPPPGATPKMPLDVAQCTLGAGTPFPPCPRPHSSRQRALLGRVFCV